MTEFELTENGLFEKHKHMWNHKYEMCGIPPIGHVKIAYICSVCGKESVVEGFHDGRSIDTTKEYDITYDINNIELLELDI